MTALLAYRVSAVVLAAVVAFALIELIALLAIAGRTKWIPTSWGYLTHPLTGDDGRLSFTKLFSVFVALLYALGAPVPAVVACFLIASAHGTKVLLALIESRTATVADSSSTTASEVRSSVAKPGVGEILEAVYDKRRDPPLNDPEVP